MTVDGARGTIVQNRRPELTGAAKLGGDASLRTYDTGTRLEIAHLVALEREIREARLDGASVEHLMIDPVPPGHRGCLVEKVASPMMLGPQPWSRKHEQTAGLHQLFARFGLQLAPDRVAAGHKRDVVVPLAHGPAGEAGLAVA